LVKDKEKCFSATSIYEKRKPPYVLKVDGFAQTVVENIALEDNRFILKLDTDYAV
jgi:hypothetical protein